MNPVKTQAPRAKVKPWFYLMAAAVLVSCAVAGGAVGVWSGINFILRYRPDVDLVGFNFSSFLYGLVGGVVGLIVGAVIVEWIGSKLHKKK